MKKVILLLSFLHVAAIVESSLGESWQKWKKTILVGTAATSAGIGLCFLYKYNQENKVRKQGENSLALNSFLSNNESVEQFSQQEESGRLNKEESYSGIPKISSEDSLDDNNIQHDAIHKQSGSSRDNSQLEKGSNRQVSFSGIPKTKSQENVSEYRNSPKLLNNGEGNQEGSAVLKDKPAYGSLIPTSFQQPNVVAVRIKGKKSNKKEE